MSEPRGDEESPPRGEERAEGAAPQRGGRLARVLELAGQGALALVALGHLGLLGYVFLHRVGYPFDLEWMEGGMLTHSWRILRGLPVYAAPSVDFVSYLYTPLYPALVAAFGRIVGLSYTLGRVVSVASLVTVLVLAYRAARREGATRAVALLPAALVAAAFPFCGAWYDIVRNDELFLALTTAGLYVLAYHHRYAVGAGLAGLLLALAFFTKQTGSAFIIVGFIGLCVLRLRAVPIYLLSCAAVLGLVGGLLQRASGGWFWTIIYRLHQNHDFYPKRAFLETPLTLFKQAPVTLTLMLLLLGWALYRRRLSRSSFLWVLSGFAGIGIACVGFGTQWAFFNAFIPGVVFPGVALAVLAGRVVGRADGGTPGDLRSQVVGLVVALLCAGQLAWSFYDPRPYLPSAAARQNGHALIARLRQAQGPVFIPDHPYYAVLAGQPAHFHRMGLWDVGRAGLGVPRGLVASFREQRWALVVMDSRTRWHQWPGLRRFYRVVDTARPEAMPLVYSGAGAATEKVFPLLYPRYFMEPVARGGSAGSVPTGSGAHPAAPASQPRRLTAPGAAAP